MDQEIIAGDVYILPPSLNKERFILQYPSLENKKIVEVNLKNNVKIQEKDGIKVIKAKDTLYKIEVDMNKTTMDELMGLFKADDLQDITISSEPLEEIIKEIYRGKDE